MDSFHPMVGRVTKKQTRRAQLEYLRLVDAGEQDVRVLVATGVNFHYWEDNIWGYKDYCGNNIDAEYDGAVKDPNTTVDLYFTRMFSVVHNFAINAVHNEFYAFDFTHDIDATYCPIWYDTIYGQLRIPNNVTHRRQVVRRCTIGYSPSSLAAGKLERFAVEIRFGEASLDGCLALCRDHMAFTLQLRVVVLFKFFERHHRGDQGDGTFACLAVVMRRRCRIGAVNADTVASVDRHESRGDGSGVGPGTSKKYNGCVCSDTSGGDCEMYIDDAVSFGGEPLDASVVKSFPGAIRALPFVTHEEAVAMRDSYSVTPWPPECHPFLQIPAHEVFDDPCARRGRCEVAVAMPPDLKLNLWSIFCEVDTAWARRCPNEPSYARLLEQFTKWYG